MPVIDQADQVRAPLLDIKGDARAARIEGILQQFLDDTRGPLDDFARGYLGDNRWRQVLNARHMPPLSTISQAGLLGLRSLSRMAHFILPGPGYNLALPGSE